MKVGDQLIYLARLHGRSKQQARSAATRWTEQLGVAGRWNDPLENLSLGNQQRVQLAAALVHDPEVLVLDEPFAGLDPMAVDVMSAVLTEKAGEGVPVIFSSHQLELVERLCDRVGIVSAGSLVADGTVEELRAGGPSRLIVHAPQAPPGWADGLAGVRTIGSRDGRTELELDSDGDDQAVLDAARATGPVHEFIRHRPGLAELFREVVSG
jgi:ABC-2 type transport system ATP-binding protein